MARWGEATGFFIMAVLCFAVAWLTPRFHRWLEVWLDVSPESWLVRNVTRNPHRRLYQITVIVTGGYLLFLAVVAAVDG